MNLLVGGYDTASHEPHLYWVDYLGTMTEVPFGAHGYGSYFALSLLDRCVFLSYLIIRYFCLSVRAYTDGVLGITTQKPPLKKA